MIPVLVKEESIDNIDFVTEILPVALCEYPVIGQTESGEQPCGEPAVYVMKEYITAKSINTTRINNTNLCEKHFKEIADGINSA